MECMGGQKTYQWWLPLFELSLPCHFQSGCLPSTSAQLWFALHWSFGIWNQTPSCWPCCFSTWHECSIPSHPPFLWKMNTTCCSAQGIRVTLVLLVGQGDWNFKKLHCSTNWRVTLLHALTEVTSRHKLPSGMHHWLYEENLG
jgi:hypothetical protein